jgi:hypothetical protein
MRAGVLSADDRSVRTTSSPSLASRPTPATRLSVTVMLPSVLVSTV